jgi:hypothetical protein
MNPKTIAKLQYFINKIVTVFTGQINRNFDEQHSREHFTVRVREIDSDGLWGTHPYNEAVSFFPLSEIKLITEEIVLNPDNPEHAKMIQKYQEKTGKTIMSDISPHMAPVLEPPPSQLVQIDGLTPKAEKRVAPSPPPPPPKTEPAFVDINHLSALAKAVKNDLDFNR